MIELAELGNVGIQKIQSRKESSPRGSSSVSRRRRRLQSQALRQRDHLLRRSKIKTVDRDQRSSHRTEIKDRDSGHRSKIKSEDRDQRSRQWTVSKIRSHVVPCLVLRRRRSLMPLLDIDWLLCGQTRRNLSRLMITFRCYEILEEALLFLYCIYSSMIPGPASSATGEALSSGHPGRRRSGVRWLAGRVL